MTTPAPPPITLGAYIKAARQAAGLSQEAVATRTGASQGSVSHWETDKATPSASAIAALADALPDAELAVMLDLLPRRVAS